MTRPVDHLQQQLNAFVCAAAQQSLQRTAAGELTPPSSFRRPRTVTSRPEKADAAFFSTTLMADGLRYENIPEGVRGRTCCRHSRPSGWRTCRSTRSGKPHAPPELTGAVRPKSCAAPDWCA
ncbi:MAG: hypothetical protein ACLR31_21520 [Escherichia coli]